MIPDYAAPLSAADTWHAASRSGGLVVTAVKRITADDPYLLAHFPGRPVYPGVFILETVRQAVLAALAAERQPGHTASRSGEPSPPGLVDVAAVYTLRFIHPLVPGDLMRAGVQVSAPDAGGGRRAQARCKRGDGTEVATMTLGFGAVEADHRNGQAPAPWLAPELAALDYSSIRAILPHGAQMVLLDRAHVLGSRKRLQAIKTVSGTEPCYHQLGAGPPADRFAYPASLIIESFGQAAAVLWLSAAAQPGDGLPMFAVARNCRIEARVYPGDVLRHEVTLERSIAGTGLASGETWVGGTRVATFGSIIAALSRRTADAGSSRP